MWGLSCALASACGAGSTDRCEPGAVEVCACPSGGEGTQTCAADGRGLLACTGCPTPLTNDAGASCGAGRYPCGPYGYAPGSTIANLELVGQRDDNANGYIDSGDTAVVLRLSDLVAAPGVQALVIDVCPAWCANCRADQPNLIAMYQSYQPGGHVAFYGVMPQALDSSPADLKAVDLWGKTFRVPYPMSADPALSLVPYFTFQAYPEHLVIRTRDMTIAWSGEGALDADLQTQIDAVLANP
jgi:hypothetical protein